ncbi:MAG: tautomerase family protein [Hyphomicrobiales bacterium]|nr:MAG: tautomerase family protein [Hyphomicrobiales bacterium]
MPSTRLETRTGWLAGRHAALAAAIQQALVESIKIPEHDRDIRILEYPAEAFLPPPGRGANYSVLEISLFTGRSLDAKRKLFAALAAALAPFGLGEGDLKVILIDVPRENWGLRGKSAADLELGFKIDV